MKTGPCKGCEDRRVGCHADCAKYLEWAAQKRAVHQAERMDRIVEAHVMDLNRKSVQRALYGYDKRKK